MTMIKSNLPFSIVKDEGIQDLCLTLDKQINFKHPVTYSRQKLPLLMRNIKREVDRILLGELSHVRSIALTADFWKSRANQMFINLSFHYVNSKGRLRHFCQGFLGWNDREFAKDICAGFTRMIHDIPGCRPGKDHSLVMVTDSDYKMVSAATLCEQIALHLPCVDHLLQTALKHAFEPKALLPTHLVSEAFRYGKALIGRIHQSDVSKNIVKKVCDELGSKNYFTTIFKM